MKKEKYISNPRPPWRPEDVDETRRRRVMTLGSNTAGMVVRVTKKGIELNGYYAGIREPIKHAIVRDFILISWDDFDKMRADAFLRKPVRKKIVERDPDMIDEKPDQEYLDTLPKVTLNGIKYYIDVDLQERRPVDTPERVFNFEQQAAKEPT